MSWFNTEGKDSHHVIYSKTCYIRNLAGLPFTGKLGDKNCEAVFKKIDAILSKNGFSREEISEGESLTALSLAEKGFVDEGFLSSGGKRLVYCNEPCSLSVALGGRDIISISSLLSGLALPDTRNIASGAEELLDRSVEFAYSDGTGYLSATPALCGSGVTFSALLYLPAFSERLSADRIGLLCSGTGAEISAAFTHGKTDLYFITYSPPHLCDESGAAESFAALIRTITDREKELEGIIFEEKGKIINDRAWKAYGQLYFGKTLSEEEMLSLSSCMRLAICLSDGKSNLPPISLTLLNRMLGEYLNASCAANQTNCFSEEDCEEARAKLVSSLLSSAV